MPKNSNPSSLTCPECGKPGVSAAHVLGHRGGRAGRGAAKRRSKAHYRRANARRFQKEQP